MKQILFLSLLALSSEYLFADDISAVVVHSEFGEDNGSVALEISAGIAPYIFSWTGPGGFTSADQDISGLVPGEYCVMVNDYLCGVAELCVTVEELPFVQINDPAAGSISVYPNPFNQQLDISFTVLNAGNYSFSLTDESGRIIWDDQPVLQPGDHIFHLNTGEQLTPGIYNLIMKDEKNGVFISRVVCVK